ncbi:MAG: 1,4-alpha-glucan branching protein GlgB [Coriobacteriales bacterium]|nr:1,4-alpha-glucan branching protein GlgB [Coriobacteriales bacterium]
MDTRNFYAGEEFFAQLMLGASITNEGVRFRTFAPAAERVELVLEDELVPMSKVADGNFWEANVAGAHAGQAYEYRIWHGGSYVDHADPYAFQSELRPAHRSVVADLSFEWHDAEWMSSRTDCHNRPMSVYELHLGSWRKRSGDEPSDDPADWYTYAELAEVLPKYLVGLGATHVEFLPLNEHPFDGSWGYQPTGFFAPTSRYGTPTQLMALIDALHAAGIGCIIDFVPVHFATDAWGLADYDGTPLFEYPNDAVGVSEWGSRNFMHSRGETCSFLQSAANFWLGAYHFDGIRLDAISRIIYWQGDEARGINGMATDFVKTFNNGLRSLNPGCFTVAEDSTSLAGCTKPVEQGGLGFDYKWDMGWMHDTLELFQTGLEYRRDGYHKLTFSMAYFGNERYLLPFSHDEVVHGKATIAQKMAASEVEDKLAQARTLYLYMFAHPGKKLNFMGWEVAQLREWDERREQDWFLRDYPAHDAFFRFACELGAIYRNEPALWEMDYDERGFEWVESSDEEDVTYAFLRKDEKGSRVLCAFNLSGKPVKKTLSIEGASAATLLLNTDWQRYGGSTPNDSDSELACGKAGLTLTMPACSGKLVRMLGERAS